MNFKTLFLLAATVHSVCAQSIAEIATQAKLSAFVATVTKAGVLDAVSDLKNVTILAPNDAAFAAIASTAEGLTNQQLAAILQNHIFPGVVLSSQLVNGAQIKSVLGNDIPVSLTTENGQAVARFGSAKVVSVDNRGSFGVVHIIDSVLVPNPVPAGPVPFRAPSIAEVAAEAQLSDFVATATKAGVLDVVGTLQNVTILAPNNAAFAAIASVAQGLTNEQLAAILQNHIFPGVVLSSQLVNGTQIKSVLGNDIPISLTHDHGQVVARFGSAKVVSADNRGSFGVVHVIDSVLVPNPVPAGPVPFPSNLIGGNNTSSSNNRNGRQANNNAGPSSFAFSVNKVSVGSFGAGMIFSLMSLLAL